MNNNFLLQNTNLGNNEYYQGTEQNIQYTKKKKEAVYHGGNIPTDNAYRYFCSMGNNGQLIKRVLDTREWWKETNQYNSAYNFKWVCSSSSIKFERLGGKNTQQSLSGVKQMVNQFEFHKEITTKSCLIKNMKIFSETNKCNIFDMTPCTFVLDLNDTGAEWQLSNFVSFFLKNLPKSKQHLKPDSIKKAVYDLKKRFKPLLNNFSSEKSQKQSIYTKPKMHPSFLSGDKNLWLIKPDGLNRGRGIQIFTELDEFEKYMFEFMQIEDVNKQNQQQTDKNDKTEKIESKNNENEIQTKTKSQQNQNLDTDNKESKSHFENQNNSKNSNDKKKQINNSKENNKDQEISLKDIDKDTLQDKDQSNKDKDKENDGMSNPLMKQNNAFVIQKYIENPLLIDNRKFDIRVWTIVTHTNDVYFFSEGYIRTSCEVFDINSENYYVHLTNNAVQRHSANYGQYESGNLITFENFHKLMVDLGNDKCDFMGRILPSIKDYCYMTIQSVKKKLNPEDRKSCFQIFGYDYIIDDDFNLWLIEVNNNPCLEETAPYLEQILPRMIDDAFKLTIDQIFPRKKIVSYPQYQNLKENNQSQIQQNNDVNLVAQPQQQNNLNQIIEKEEKEEEEQQPQDGDENNSPSKKCKKKSFPVDGYPDDQNMWILLGNLINKNNNINYSKKVNLLKSKYAVEKEVMPKNQNNINNDNINNE